jgi:hypothetical protein
MISREIFYYTDITIYRVTIVMSILIGDTHKLSFVIRSIEIQY